MGRMFRILSETTGPFPVQTPLPQSVAPFRMPPTESVGVIPFIEVGGPDGLVTSIPFPRTTTRVPAEPEPAVPNPPIPEPVEQSSPKPEPRVALSVAIHRFLPRNPQLAEPQEYDDLIVVHDPQHPVSAEYRAIADAIENQLSITGSRTVLMTAALPTSGTTTVITNLAAVLATRSRGRVALVDANLLRPTVAGRLNVQSTPGLVELLNQTVPLSWVVQPTPVERLSVIAAGRDLPENPSSLQDIPRLLSQLRDWFDWILIDGGVWSESIAGDVLVPASDGIYFVCRENQVDPDAFADLRETLEGIGGHPRGYVTTRG